MLSPISGKEMEIRKVKSSLVVRKEEFPIVYHTWYCSDSGEEFEDEAMLETNLRQAMDQYRSKHNLPFPEEIREIREQYGISAAKMSEVLRFGINQYKQYENGELPSESNASLILLARSPKDFSQLVEWSNVDDKEKEELKLRAKKLEANNDYSVQQECTTKFLMRSLQPSAETGFRKPDPYKFAAITHFFASKLSTIYKTRMNKLLFYADFTHFRAFGRGISGAKYRAIAMGPVPDNFDSLFQFAEDEGFIKLEHHEYDNGAIGTKFLPGTRGLELSADEISTLERVFNRFGNVKSQEIINLSHNEEAWLKNVKAYSLISYLDSYLLKEI